jgi:hypothetical protein
MRPAAACLLGALLFVLPACGGSDDGGAASGPASVAGDTLEELWRAPGDDVAITPGTKTFVPGDVRVSFIVVDSEGRVALAPTAKVLVARGLDQPPFAETTARLERIGVPGGRSAASTHIYVTHLDLTEPGKYWIMAEPEGGPKVQALGNVVVGSSRVPGVGERPPASKTPTLASAGGNVSSLTTDTPPDLALLRYSVADSLAAGVPFVVTFATPAFCESRTCGPVVDIVEEVERRSRGTGVRFIHVEVYEDNDPVKGLNRWMKEWHLRTEPWTFVVGADGRVVERFEGPVSVRELERSVGGLTS